MDYKNNFSTDKNYIYPAAALVLSLLTFSILWLLKPLMLTTIENTHFLSIHILLELLSIIFAFSIFTLIFYIYRENSNTRFTILAATFYISGWVDIFHTLSYNGMPVFFTASSAPKATAFWIIARLVMSAGFLLSALSPKDKTTRLSRYFVIFWSSIISLLVFYLVTYFPHVIPVYYIEGKGLTPLKVRTEYLIIVLQGITALLYAREYGRTGHRASILFSTALIISIFSELHFTLYVSVYDLYNFTGHVFKILAYMIMFNILFVYNVRLPYQKLKEAELQLRNHSEELKTEVEKARQQILYSTRKIYRDIEHARILQQSMLPERYLKLDGVEFFSALIPCEDLSGDFFNIFQIDDDHIGMYLVDVSGHGISPSIMTIFTDRTILSNRLVTYKQQLLLSPSKILEDLFSIYNESNFPSEMYLLMFYGVYNRKTGEFVYSSAGLNTEPYFISGSEAVALKTETVFPICKMGEYYSPAYKDKSIVLKPGDKILFYSDGLAEAKNRQGIAFTVDRLRHILTGNPSASAEEMFYEIFDRISCFVLDEKLGDDVTFFLMHII